MEANEFVNNPTQEEISSLIKEGYNILCRILKENNHFLLYRKACFEGIKRSDGFKDYDYEKCLSVPPLESLAILFKTQKYSVCYWSIHREVDWESLDGWQNGFSSSERVMFRIPNIYAFLIFIIGIQLNLYGMLLNYGYFYSDFQKFKRKIIREKILIKP